MRGDEAGKRASRGTKRYIALPHLHGPIPASLIFGYLCIYTIC